MEATHIVGTGTVRAINLHLPMETIVEHQTMDHRQSMGLHRMARSVMEVTHLRVIKVCDFLVIAHVEVSYKQHEGIINIISRLDILLYSSKGKCHKYKPHIPIRMKLRTLIQFFV